MSFPLLPPVSPLLHPALHFSALSAGPVVHLLECLSQSFTTCIRTCWLAHGRFRCLPKGQDQINISAGESKEAAVTPLFSHLLLAKTVSQQCKSRFKCCLIPNGSTNQLFCKRECVSLHEEGKIAPGIRITFMLRMQSLPLQTWVLSTWNLPSKLNNALKKYLSWNIKADIWWLIGCSFLYNILYSILYLCVIGQLFV